MDESEVQVRAEAAGAVHVGRVAAGVVAVDRTGEEVVGPAQSRLLARLGEVGLEAGAAGKERPLTRTVPPHQSTAGGSMGSSTPASRHARWNGVNTAYGLPSALVTVPGSTA